MSEDDLDDSRALCEELSPGQEWELQEAEQQPEVERGGDRKDQGDC